jgi:hypothetical protein
MLFGEFELGCRQGMGPGAGAPSQLTQGRVLPTTGGPDSGVGWVVS